MLAASVIVCAHNPRPNYLSRVFEALRQQTLDKGCWELLLIDNLSDEPLAGKWDMSWHPNARHIHEPELGLAPARRRGMCEASSDLLVFVDDDNVLAADYLSQALRIEEEWPRLGVWGSASIVPEFEAVPPDHLKKFLPLLALREIKEARWSSLYAHNGALCKDAAPWGAGLCVRAKVGEEYLSACGNSSIQVTGRRGGSLVSGEDIEISIVACHSGWGMGIFPELHLVHLIPTERLSDEHFLKLWEGMAFSDFLLTNKWLGAVPRSPSSMRGLAGHLKNLITRRGMDRRMYMAYQRGAANALKTIALSHRGSDDGKANLGTHPHPSRGFS